MWNSLVRMPDRQLAKQIFSWDHSKSVNNWSAEVKCILEGVNMGNIFENITRVNVIDFATKCRENLICRSSG